MIKIQSEIARKVAYYESEISRIETCIRNNGESSQYNTQLVAAVSAHQALFNLGVKIIQGDFDRS